MSRIFLALSTLVVILLLVGNIHGFLAGDYNAAWRELTASRAKQVEQPTEDADPADVTLSDTFLRTQRQSRIHTMMGLFVSLIGVLVQSLCITYFIGTGRWCKEVTQAYQLNTELLAESVRLKRRSFPWALLGMGSLLAIAATGAAADPGTLLPATEQWVRPHAIVSVAGTVVIWFALWKQYQYLKRNQEVIEQIVERVRVIRHQKGL